MGDHWPLVVASGLIALAAALGLWQHDRAAEVAANIPQPIRPVVATAPAPAVVPAAPTAAPVAEKIDAPAAIPSVPTQTRTSTLPAVTVPAPAIATPAPVTATPAVREAPPVNPLPVVAVPNPAVPNAQLPNAAPPADKRGRSATLAALRAALQAKMNIAPMDTAGGGYALATEGAVGARLEVKPTPNWGITIYNINPKTPEVETDQFKDLLQTTIASLQIDMAPKPVESANGKSYLKTTSKLGSISLIRDPVNGNSCVIGPIQQWVAPPATPAKNPDAPAVPLVEIKRPAPPTTPAPPKTPAIPPRPPATDANF